MLILCFWNISGQAGKSFSDFETFHDALCLFFTPLADSNCTVLYHEFCVKTCPSMLAAVSIAYETAIWSVALHKACINLRVIFSIWVSDKLSDDVFAWARFFSFALASLQTSLRPPGLDENWFETTLSDECSLMKLYKLHGLITDKKNNKKTLYTLKIALPNWN